MAESLEQLASRYAVTVLPDPYEAGFVAHVPDFIGVCAAGSTPAEALACAYEGIASILGVMIEDGEVLPAPSVTVPIA